MARQQTNTKSLHKKKKKKHKPNNENHNLIHIKKLKIVLQTVEKPLNQETQIKLMQAQQKFTEEATVRLRSDETITT